MLRKRSPLTIARLGQLDTLVADRPRLLTRPLPLRIRVQLPAETLRSLVAAAATGTLAEVEIPHGEIPWTSDPIMLTDTPTGDGRTFLSSGADHGALPLPLMANLSTTWGHDGAENCGRIETITWAHPQVKASGFFADTDFARDVVRAVVAKNVRGISVDLRDMDGEVEIIEDDEGYISSMEFTATQWKIDGATVTPFPAFDDAEIVASLPTTSAEEEPVETMSLALGTLEVIGDPDLPFADREQEWDSTAAETSVRQYASSDGSGDEDTIDWDTYGRAFFYRDPDADPETFDAYSIGFAEFADDRLRAVPRGIFAVAAVLQGSRGGTDIPQEDQDRLKERVGAYYARMADEFDDPTIVPPWDADEEASTQPTALVASARRRIVAASFFQDPMLEEITPPTFDDHAGRYFGHAALWDECHAGYVDACFLAPRSETDYAYFLTGGRRTDGGEAAVGHVTLGTGHAPEELDWRQAMAHYDNTGTCVADVVTGEDEFGIWFSGQPVRGITDDQLERMMAHALSGDWRWVAGNLEMVALLAVNVPGYVVPRVKAQVRNDRVFSLVASGARRLEVLHQQSRKPVSLSEHLALKRQVERLARADALRRIHAADCSCGH